MKKNGSHSKDQTSID